MQVAIRKFEAKDIPYKVKWINDARNNKYLHYDLPLREDKTLVWFEKNKDRQDRYDTVILADGEPVGLIGLLGIDSVNKKAEYYITIGVHEFKGKGVADEASQLILQYAFEVLKLNKVYLYTETENINAQRLFERVGFRKEGLLVNDLICNGRKVDRFYYGITFEEYNSGSNHN